VHEALATSAEVTGTVDRTTIDINKNIKVAEPTFEGYMQVNARLLD